MMKPENRDTFLGIFWGVVWLVITALIVFHFTCTYSIEMLKSEGKIEFIDNNNDGQQDVVILFFSNKIVFYYFDGTYLTRKQIKKQVEKSFERENKQLLKENNQKLKLVLEKYPI